MKRPMIVPALLLTAMAVPAFAQEMNTGPTGGAAREMAPPAADPATPASPESMSPPGPSPEAAMPATPPTDPNAGIPTGEVPPAASGMVPATPGVPHNPTAPVGSAANPAIVGGNMTAPPPPQKDYPVCTRTIRDQCINPGEARGARRSGR